MRPGSPEFSAQESPHQATFYEEKLQIKLLPEDREQITAVERVLGRAGTALTHRDLGKTTEAKSEFQTLAQISPFERDDLHALAQEGI